MSGPTASARLDGSVHGVVVHASTRSPRLELEPHGQRRVLAVAVDVVHPRLGVAERCLAAPAVGEHPEALVDQTLVPQGLERPHDAFHVVEVEGLVVVLEVDPAGLAGDVALPLAGVPQHARATERVELVDAEGGDRRVAGDAELALGFDLGRQAVTVPSEAALDASPTHRLVARHGVLDEAGQEVPVVRQAVGERRAVVEHVLVAAVLAGGAQLDRRLERVVVRPSLEHGMLQRREVGLRIDVGISRGSHRWPATLPTTVDLLVAAGFAEPEAELRFVVGLGGPRCRDRPARRRPARSPPIARARPDRRRLDSVASVVVIVAQRRLGGRPNARGSSARTSDAGSAPERESSDDAGSSDADSRGRRTRRARLARARRCRAGPTPLGAAGRVDRRGSARVGRRPTRGSHAGRGATRPRSGRP